jgi:anti-anti-sigma regulatory factor
MSAIIRLPAMPDVPAEVLEGLGTLCLVLHGSANLATAHAVRDAAVRALASGRDVTVACGEVEYLDTAVLQVLLALKAALGGYGRTLALEGVTDKGLGYCRTAGLMDLLGLT